MDPDDPFLTRLRLPEELDEPDRFGSTGLRTLDLPIDADDEFDRDRFDDDIERMLSSCDEDVSDITSDLLFCDDVPLLIENLRIRLN